jgi:threonine/homoserine/homoserine lactone efflux protein
MTTAAKSREDKRRSGKATPPEELLYTLRPDARRQIYFLPFLFRYGPMLTFEQSFGFLLAATLITASPGPDNLMVLGMGISKGRKQGIAFGLGCALGCLSHTLLAVIGVSALIAASPAAFTALKVGGGLYLVWLGFNALRSSGAAKVEAVKAEQTPSKLFFKGVVANAINPKVVLFFLSFLPQFVISANGNLSWQIAALGLIFTAQAAVLFSLLGYFSGAIGQWLNTKPKAGAILDRIAGTVFIALGLRLIVSR